MEQRGHFPSAVVAVEIAGVRDGVRFHLGQIPHAKGSFRLVPRVNLTNGLANLAPLLAEVSANHFGGSAFKSVAGERKMEVKPLVFAVALFP
jgi:hypothetical protein